MLIPCIVVLLIVDAVLMFAQLGTDKFLAAHIKNLYKRIEDLESKEDDRTIRN